MRSNSFCIARAPSTVLTSGAASRGGMFSLKKGPLTPIPPRLLGAPEGLISDGERLCKKFPTAGRLIGESQGTGQPVVPANTPARTQGSTAVSIVPTAAPDDVPM